MEMQESYNYLGIFNHTLLTSSPLSAWNVKVIISPDSSVGSFPSGATVGSELCKFKACQAKGVSFSSKLASVEKQKVQGAHQLVTQ